MPIHRKGKASRLSGAHLCQGRPIFRVRSMEHTKSPSLASHGSTLPGEQAARGLPQLQPCPQSLVLERTPCPGHADKYGNSIFIGCINICLYIHFIHHSAGPEGRAQREAPAAQQLPPLSQSPICSVQTKANSSCSRFLPEEVTVWGGGQRSRG